MSQIIKIPEDVLSIQKTLYKHGIESWVVGGCVRDSLRGFAPNDWDMTAAASPEEIISSLHGMRLVMTGLKHGTVTVVTGMRPVEVTACREDGEYRDSRHPESVRFTRSVVSDLSRRDFTINAMAYSPGDGIIDLFGGRGDLQAGIIRCVGVPEKRFREDALRILRAARFASKLDFFIEPETRRAMSELRLDLRKISAERRYAELSKLFEGPAAPRVIMECGDIIAAVSPEADRFSAEKWEILSKLAEHLDDWQLRFAVLFYGDPDAAGTALLSLRAPNAVIFLITSALKTAEHLPAGSGADMKRLMRDFGPPAVRDGIKIRRADSAARRNADISLWDAQFSMLDEILERGDCWNLKSLSVNGQDMKTLGYAGTEVGAALNRALDAVIEGRCENQKDKLIALLAN